MNTVSIQSQAGEMIYIFIYGSFAVESQIAECAVGMGKRQGVVYPEERGLFVGVAPAHHSVSIYIYYRCSYFPLHTGEGKQQTNKGKNKLSFHAIKFGGLFIPAKIR